MTQGPTESPSAQTQSSLPEAQRSFITLAASVGVILTVISVVVGLGMAFQRKVVPCPDGHQFPPGTTDFRCFIYPQAGEGSALAMLSIMLGLIIILCSIIAAATLKQPK
jgi:hypothetical protein